MQRTPQPVLMQQTDHQGSNLTWGLAAAWHIGSADAAHSEKQLWDACLVILERKSMPLCSSSTLMGASVFALSTSFVFFACSIDDTIHSPQGPLQPPNCRFNAAKMSQTLCLAFHCER